LIKIDWSRIEYDIFSYSQTRSAMHDLNSAARTDETAASDSAAQSNDFEVNMIIKEFEDELSLQVCTKLCAGIRTDHRSIDTLESDNEAM